jgi:KaiC/GvpD/RAD55 family RecA-like ATPase
MRGTQHSKDRKQFEIRKGIVIKGTSILKN